MPIKILLRVLCENLCVLCVKITPYGGFNVEGDLNAKERKGSRKGREGEKDMTQLTHIDEQGKVRMVDTSAKAITTRRALASARVLMSPETIAAVQADKTPKGDPLEAARLAGIMAAKR